MRKEAVSKSEMVFFFFIHSFHARHNLSPFSPPMYGAGNTTQALMPTAAAVIHLALYISSYFT